MVVHNLKTWIEPFEAIEEGIKSFEYRKNDREFKAGDTLFLDQWNQYKKEYTGRCLKMKITYILTDGFGIPDGYCIMSIKPIKG